MMELDFTRYFTVTLILALLLVGCSGSSDDQKNEKAGDQYTVSYSIDANYSNGQTANIYFENTTKISDVSSIPDKYNYSNSISGPYKLATTTKDGALDELKYTNELDDFIIEDGLEFFTSADFRTQTGSDDPNSITVGDNFIYDSDSTLFNSDTGAEVGTETTHLDITIQGTESITVPAGTFDAAKASYSITYSKTVNSMVDTESGAGFVWFVLDDVPILKLTLNGNSTLTELGLTATYTSEMLLHNYSITPKTQLVQTVQSMEFMAPSNKSLTTRELVSTIKNQLIQLK